MSLTNTKNQLIDLLNEEDNNVIALSGKWGTGKTHLWKEIKNSSNNDRFKNALYVSLFGLSSIDQIKRKLIETAIPNVESHGGVFDGIKSLFGAGVKVASEHYKVFAAINNINVLLMAPVVLRNKVIVIDDIERKHEKLGIDEVLGFIDEYSKQYGSQFLLVLNDDQLSSKGEQEKLWATFREKVIDQEIRLSTTADEAFSIAISLAPSKYAAALRSATSVCGINNIRIIVKIIRVANRILGGRHLDDVIQARVIPSIVLFSAIHYHGMEDGLDFGFALNVGNPSTLDLSRGKDKSLTPEQTRNERWRSLMYDLGIYGCDEFEKVLVDFLESGLFDLDKIEVIVSRYLREKDTMHANHAAQLFMERVFWHHRLSEDELVLEAVKLQTSAALLDPFAVTQLNTTLDELSGGAEVGEKIVDEWVKAFKNNPPTKVNDDNPFNNPLHPKIKAEFDAIKQTAQANTTVVDACIHVIDHGGWGTIQEVAMRQASVADFNAAIRNTEDPSIFRRFMRRMIEMRVNKKAYDDSFGGATERFVEACRDIANDTTEPRLAGLVKKLFAGASLADELTVEPPCDNQQD